MPLCKVCGTTVNIIPEPNDIVLCIGCADDDNPYSDQEIQDYQDFHEQEYLNG